MSTHNLCFKQTYEKYQTFLSENFQFFEVKFSIYLNRRVFLMCTYTLIKNPLMMMIMMIMTFLKTAG